MVWLRKDLIPNFLRKSVLYRSLGDGESLEVEPGCYVHNTDVRNDAEFRSLLLTLIHWKVDEIPADIIRYILRAKGPFMIRLVHQYNSLPNPNSHLLFLYYLAIATVPPVETELDGFHFLCNIDKEALNVCCAHQAALVCHVHHLLSPENVWTAGTCALAAYNELPAVLCLLHEKGCPWDATTCWSAVQGDSHACLEYAHEQGCPWTSLCLKTAIQDRRGRLFLYLLDKGCPWKDSSLLSVAERALCARWARKLENKTSPEPTAATTVGKNTTTTVMNEESSMSPPLPEIAIVTSTATSGSTAAEVASDPLRPAITAALSRLSTAYMLDFPAQRADQGQQHRPQTPKRGQMGRRVSRP